MQRTDRQKTIWSHFLKCYEKKLVLQVIDYCYSDCYIVCVQTTMQDILTHLSSICLFLTQREYVKVTHVTKASLFL